MAHVFFHKRNANIILEHTYTPSDFFTQSSLSAEFSYTI